MEEKMISIKKVIDILNSSDSLDYAKEQFARLELEEGIISTKDLLQEVIRDIDSEQETFNWKDDIESKYEICIYNKYSDSYKSELNSLTYLFEGTNFKFIDLSGIPIKRGDVNTSSMFSGCTHLESVNLSCFNGLPLEFSDDMFNNCELLREIDLSEASGLQMHSTDRMFYGCTHLETVKLPNDGMPKVFRAYQMFANCKSLKEIDLSKFGYENTGSQRRLQEMFNGCSNLESVNLSQLVASRESDTGRQLNFLNEMFKGCKSLKHLDISSFRLSYITTLTGIFSGCSSLTSENVKIKDEEYRKDIEYLIKNSEHVTDMCDVDGELSRLERNKDSFSTTSMF